MAEDECLEAALDDVEVPKLPRVLWMTFTLTGLGPCPHSRPWLHKAIKYGMYISLWTRLITHAVMAVVGSNMIGVSQGERPGSNSL